MPRSRLCAAVEQEPEEEVERFQRSEIQTDGESRKPLETAQRRGASS